MTFEEWWKQNSGNLGTRWKWLARKAWEAALKQRDAEKESKDVF